ncbi:hypothetical protein F5Y10DRAFT_57912 [Nemania abortiva]|nr:hypothetical protein F5Y10DRAFT_57912 [Nemania abortiva]
MLLFQPLRGSRLGLVTWRNIALRTVPKTAPIRPFFMRTTTQSLSSIRFKTTTTVASDPAAQPSPGYVYPPRFCVYHVGLSRILFLGVVKMSALLLFAIFAFVVTPAYYKKEGLSSNAVRTAVCAVVPLVFVTYTTSPVVMFIHLRLPPFARRSREALNRYLQTLSPQTEVEIMTTSPITTERVSRVKLSDLQPVNKRFGMANMARDTTAENATRKWYKFRALGDFNVLPSRRPWHWSTIWENALAKRG